MGPHPPTPARTLALLALLLPVAACDSSSEVAGANSTVTVAYEGRLQSGAVFDRSDRATFSLQRVVPGFRAGVVGMTEGETRTFTVPPEQGYGDQVVRDGTGAVIILANSTLIFEVTLLDVR